MAITEDRLSAVGDNGTTVETTTTMRVKKRNGSLEPVDLNKIVNAIARASEGLMGVDPMVVSTRTISALADGSTTQELDELSIRTAAGLIVEEPNYSKLAARMLATYVDKEVRNQNVPWFSESVTLGHTLGLIGDDVLEFVTTHAPELNAAINSQRDKNFEFFGLRTVYDRYLLRHPETRKVIETPQYFFLRVACGLSTDADEAIKFYDLMSSLAYLRRRPPCSTRARPTHRCRAATCSTRPRTPSRASTSATPTSPASRSSRRYRCRLAPHPLQEQPDRRHQRPQQRHHPVAQDPRRLGRRR